MDNSKIIEILTRLMVLRQFENSSNVKHQVASYQRVISEIKQLPFNLTSVEDAKQYVSGIGSNIEKYLKSIFMINDPIKTGIYELDKYITEDPNFYTRIAIVSQLIQTPGIGFSKANHYFDTGVRSIHQLKDTSIDLKYVSQISKRIPHDKITHFSNILRTINPSFTIAGSYRRKTPTSKDIDVIFTNVDQNKGSEIVSHLKNRNIILQTLSLGNSKFEGIAYLDEENPAVRVDFLFISDMTEYPYALLYFTGSKQFNIAMKSHAKNLGYILGNTEMRNVATGQKIIVHSEEEIFKFLNYKYVIPEERNI